MIAVLDTNVVVSAFLFGGVPLDIISLAEASAVQLITSTAAVEELKNVLARPRFSERLRGLGITPDVLSFRYRELAATVEPGEMPHICSDDSDNLFIAIAVAGSADVIVSGDSHLQACSGVSPVPVVTPSQFLEIVRCEFESR